MRVLRTKNRCADLNSGPIPNFDHLPVTLRDGVGQVMPKPKPRKRGVNLAVGRLEDELNAEAQRLQLARLAEPLNVWIQKCRAAAGRKPKPVKVFERKPRRQRRRRRATA